MVQAIEDARRRDRTGSARIPPHNLHAEESLLGAMLLSRDAIAAAVETCATDDLYKPAHGHVFDAITTLYSRGEPADPVTVADELARAGLLEAVGGLAKLISLQADTPATTNAARYARIVEEHALLRRLIAVAGEIAEMGYSVPDDVAAAVDQAEALVFDVAERRVTDSLKPLQSLLVDTLDRLERLYDRGEAITGVPTGLHRPRRATVSGCNLPPSSSWAPGRPSARRHSLWAWPPTRPWRRRSRRWSSLSRCHTMS